MRIWFRIHIIFLAVGILGNGLIFGIGTGTATMGFVLVLLL